MRCDVELDVLLEIDGNAGVVGGRPVADAGDLAPGLLRLSVEALSLVAGSERCRCCPHRCRWRQAQCFFEFFARPMSEADFWAAWA